MAIEFGHLAVVNNAVPKALVAQIIYSKLEPETIMRNLTALAFILLLTASAQASHESRRGPDLTYSCETVRWASTKFTHEQLMAYAKEYGITLKQRRQAMACVSTARKAD
ncbi:MAG: hypothetical protein ACXWNN_14940 [Candidatus Binataceae bacterium]